MAAQLLTPSPSVATETTCPSVASSRGRTRSRRCGFDADAHGYGEWDKDPEGQAPTAKHSRSVVWVGRMRDAPSWDGNSFEHDCPFRTGRLTEACKMVKATGPESTGAAR